MELSNTSFGTHRHENIGIVTCFIHKNQKKIDYNVIENAFKEIPKMNENAYQKYLQFKLLHLRTATNEKLFKMNIKNTNICPLCKSHIESINHVFLECNFVIILWNDIEKWIKKCTKKQLN